MLPKYVKYECLQLSTLIVSSVSRSLVFSNGTFIDILQSQRADACDSIQIMHDSERASATFEIKIVIVNSLPAVGSTKQ